MPKDCTGLSASKYGTDNYYIRPRNQPIGTFLNNVAHSSTTTGLMIDDMELSDGKQQKCGSISNRCQGTSELASYSPRQGPYPTSSVSSNTVVEAVFEGFVSYKHRSFGVWTRGGPLGKFWYNVRYDSTASV